MPKSARPSFTDETGEVRRSSALTNSSSGTSNGPGCLPQPPEPPKRHGAYSGLGEDASALLIECAARTGEKENASAPVLFGHSAHVGVDV